MSFKYKDLEKLTDEQVKELYDEVAKSTAVGLNYYRDELLRRSNEKTNQLMVRCTLIITIMTAIMLIATISTTFFSIITFLK